MKFTKEEISLCVQILKRYRKESEVGDRVIFNEDLHLPPNDFSVDDRKMLEESTLPLWTISDCLEFLKNEFRSLIMGVSGEFEIRLSLYGYKYGKTPLEACLKAVLAVVEEKK